MLPPVSRRLLFAACCLAAAALACAYGGQPIEPAELEFASPLPPLPTLTRPPTATIPATLAPTATPPPTLTPAPTTTRPPDTATPGPSPTQALTRIPIDNGSFDVDLSGWELSDPERVEWHDGYARLDASGEDGASLMRTVPAPAASLVLLHFRYRSETAAGGDCTLETVFGETRTFLENNQWRSAQVDYTAEAGVDARIGVTARGSNGCLRLHFDEFYWLVPVGEPLASATPEATAEPETSATLAASTAPESIDPAAEFTRAFTVQAEGDTPFGIPSDLRDNQTITWASLRNGQGRWLFDLGSPRTMAGLRLVAHRDRDQDTTLLGIDVSLDGLQWAAAFAPATTCGETPACLILEQNTPVALPFGPVEARHVRLRGGPTAFALAEVELALLP
ncbi:MAG: discoidin domain-containing protein [Anaerolineales bacterium]|nr:discoidin domain-containing protein [Anaerolineales bacterium]